MSIVDNIKLDIGYSIFELCEELLRHKKGERYGFERWMSDDDFDVCKNELRKRLLKCSKNIYFEDDPFKNEWLVLDSLKIGYLLCVYAMISNKNIDRFEIENISDLLNCEITKDHNLYYYLNEVV